MIHQPVLLTQTIEALNINPDGIYLDCTFGRGGHSRAILEKLSENGKLLAIDQDEEAAKAASQIIDSRFVFARGRFSQMSELFAEYMQKIDGVLFDLGVSSPQLDNANRGFSVYKNGELDMRMDQNRPYNAKDLLKDVDEKTLARNIRDLGGESHTVAQRIARNIVINKDQLFTTTDLAKVVFEAIPRKLHKKNIHPATQTFQAIRMMVNDEVGELQKGLQIAVDGLKLGGVLAVISFHSLEDLLVKQFIKSQQGQELPAELPVLFGRQNARLKMILPVVKPEDAEVMSNPRCRSARLRKAVKI